MCSFENIDILNHWIRPWQIWINTSFQGFCHNFYTIKDIPLKFSVNIHIVVLYRIKRKEVSREMDKKNKGVTEETVEKLPDFTAS